MCYFNLSERNTVREFVWLRVLRNHNTETGRRRYLNFKCLNVYYTRYDELFIEIYFREAKGLMNEVYGINDEGGVWGLSSR